ncbi:MAG: hypothetical protein FWH53_01060 [Leptospirales bacterium]|nr:hypothetical protein [Leptospirales bacterium]
MINVMKRIIITTLCLCFIGIAYGKDEKVKVTFTTDELAFSINVLNSIDLVGDEVMPFMDIKNLLMDVYKDVSSGKKKNADVEFTTISAKNFLLFIQRVKLKGAEAVLFNDVSNKTVEAIKKAGN